MTPPDDIKHTLPDTPAQSSGEEGPLPKVPKTTGEKWFEGLRFAIGEVFILGLTAGIAYLSKYGEKSYFGGKVPNVIKMADEKLTEKLEPLAQRNELGKRVAETVVGTTILMHGGNLFVPVMKGLQDKKVKIVSYFNRHFGKPGEVEAGEARLENQTKESWGDIIKGRIISWGAVFTGFFAADMIAGQKKLPDGRLEYRFDRFKDKFGRMVAGLTNTSEGKEIAKTPIDHLLTNKQFENKGYRFGKILALDIFATTAALAIWTTISKMSAIVRGKKTVINEETSIDAEHRKEQLMQASAPEMPAPTAETEAKTFASRLPGRAVNFRALASQEPVSSGISPS